MMQDFNASRYEGPEYFHPHGNDVLILGCCYGLEIKLL